MSRPIYARHLMDSDAARKAIAKGLSIALRYMRKAARISLAALHDMAESIDVARVDSKLNKSDIMTKPMDQETLVRHLFELGFYATDGYERRRGHLAERRDGRGTSERGHPQGQVLWSGPPRHVAIAAKVVLAMRRALGSALVRSVGRSV